MTTLNFPCSFDCIFGISTETRVIPLQFNFNQISKQDDESIFFIVWNQLPKDLQKLHATVKKKKN